jgi:hypothetical protein
MTTGKIWFRAHLLTNWFDAYELSYDAASGNYEARLTNSVGEVSAVGNPSAAYVNAEFCTDPKCEHNLRPLPADPLASIDNPALKAAFVVINEEIADMLGCVCECAHGKDQTEMRAMANFLKSLRNNMIHAAARAIKVS